jgi:hypothetical protein
MPYDRRPDDPEHYILELARSQETRYRRQRTHDDGAFDLYLKIEKQDTQKKPGDVTRIKPLRVGLAGMVVDRNAAALASAYILKVVPRDDKVETAKHADEFLEPWLGGVITRSQVEDVLTPMKRNLFIFSRAPTNFFPLPYLWADGSEYRKLVEELQQLTEENLVSSEEGVDKKLTEEIDEVVRAIAKFKERNFPLRWKIASPRSTWPVISHERRHPEVVEIREMTKREIDSEYPGKMPADYALEDSIKLKVIEYANHAWSGTVVSHTGADVAEGALLREWEHDLGMSPYVFPEVNTQPDNDLGIYWKSPLHDFKDVLEAFNEILTDMRNIHRRGAETPLQVKLDMEMRSLDPKVAGNLNNVDITPDNNMVVHLGLNEKMEAAPSVGIADTSLELLNFLHNLVFQLVLNPATLPQMKSGQSATGFFGLQQAAKENLLPYEKTFVDALRQISALAFRSVEQLHKVFPASAEPVVVVDERFGRLGAEPKDVEGQEPFVMPRIKSVNPLSRGQQVDIVLGLMNILHPADALEIGMDAENAQKLVEHRKEWEVEVVLNELLAQMAPQFAGMLLNQTGGTAATAERIAGLPPEIQQALANSGNADAQMSAARQTAGNSRRPGNLQQPSELEGLGVL